MCQTTYHLYGNRRKFHSTSLSGIKLVVELFVVVITKSSTNNVMSQDVYTYLCYYMSQRTSVNNTYLCYYMSQRTSVNNTFLCYYRSQRTSINNKDII